MRKNRFKPLFLICMMMFVLLTGVIAVYYHLEPYEQNDLISLEDGWKVTTKDGEFDNKSLKDIPYIVGITQSKVTEISIEKTIPESLKGEVTSLALKLDFCAVDIFLNDKHVCDIYMDKVLNGKAVGRGLNIVNLPSYEKEAKLRIDCYFVGFNVYPRVGEIFFGGSDKIYADFIRKNWFALAVGAFLFIFGTIFIALSVIFSTFISEIKGQTLSAILFSLLGLYILNRFNQTSLLIGSRFGIVQEYLVAYSIVPVCYELIARIRKTDNSKIFNFFRMITLLIQTFLLILTVTDTLFLSFTRWICYALAVICIIIILVFSIRDITDSQRDDLTFLQMAGPVFLSIFFFASVVATLFKYPGVTYYLQLVGVFGFAIFRFGIYVLLLMENRPYELELSSLNELTYTDMLTGLYNRTNANERFKELDEKDIDYCLVSLDLNSLKEVNDGYGHGAGDRLIKDFARVINRVFNEDVYKARVGGDEFILIIEDTNENKIRRLLNELENEYAAVGKKDGNDLYGVAYGYSFRHEVSSDNRARAHDVFLIADARMYKFKNQQKTTPKSITSEV